MILARLVIQFAMLVIQLAMLGTASRMQAGWASSVKPGSDR
jgi:hypothetical protein